MRSVQDLKENLNSVITIPLIPFRGGVIDYDAHQKNIRYLMEKNQLSNNRPRVICIAGTSLIHHVSTEDQSRLIAVTGEVMGNHGLLISAIAPNPIADAGDLIESQSRMDRAPDGYLIMPLNGTYSTDGLYDSFIQFADHYGRNCNARFLYYYRQPRDRNAIARLVCDCEYFVGVKVGTIEEDVPVMNDLIGDAGIVIWGVGDRSTNAARLGAKGHTSGISVLFAGAGDALNNAQREGNFEKSQAMEDRIALFEEIRFENGREFNYSAVVEAMIMSGFEDVDGGEGGPFNPRVPPEVAQRIRAAIEPILDLH